VELDVIEGPNTPVIWMAKLVKQMKLSQRRMLTWGWETGGSQNSILTLKKT
jgi:hypothetical protein